MSEPGVDTYYSDGRDLVILTLFVDEALLLGKEATPGRTKESLVSHFDH